MDVNSAAAGSEFEACMLPIPYFIAAKFIMCSAAAGLCIHPRMPFGIICIIITIRFEHTTIERRESHRRRF